MGALVVSILFQLLVLATMCCRASDLPDQPHQLGQGNNTQSDTAPTASVSVTQSVTQSATQPVTVVTQPATQSMTVVTQPVTQELQNSVAHALTSVEPGITEDTVDTDRTSTSTPPDTTLVTMTTSDVTTPVLLLSTSNDPALSPPLSVSDNVSAARTYDIIDTMTVSSVVSDVSPDASSSVSPNVSSSTVSPGMTSLLSLQPNMSSVVTEIKTSVMSPVIQTTSVLSNMSSWLTTSSLEVSAQPGDTVNTSTVADIEGSVTPLQSMSPTMTPPMSTLTVSLDTVTSVINVSTAVTIDITSTVVDVSPLSTQPSVPDVVTTLVTPSDRVYKLTFDGNCSLLELPGFRQQFVKVLSSLIKIKFKITDENLKIAKEIACGSLVVEVQLFNLTDPSLDGKMESLTSINVTTANVTFYISLLKVATVPLDGKSHVTSMATTTETMSLTTNHPALYQVDKLIVIVFSIVGGTLLILAGVYAVYSCRTRKHKSFDLGNTPTANVHLEDFTLTKMTRSHPMYSDQGVIVALESHDTNSDARLVSPGSAFQGQQGYFPKTTGPLSTFQPQRLIAVDGGGDRQGDSRDMVLTGRQGSDGNLTHTFRSESPSHTGFDNPSFSSEDILDSGTEDNVEDMQQPGGLTEGATPF